MYLLLLFAGNQLGCCCLLFLKSTASLERCVSSSFLSERKKHGFFKVCWRGWVFLALLIFGVFLILLFKGRARGRKFGEQEAEGARPASRRGEVLSPCGARGLRHPSGEVKFISHKSHVKCLRGEVIKQMYEARGKVHPFQKTLPVSAALQKSREAEGSNRHGSSFPDSLLFISSSIYLMAFSLLEQLPGPCCALSQLPSAGAVGGEGGGGGTSNSSGGTEGWSDGWRL